VVVHPTPGPAPQGAVRKRIFGVLSGTKVRINPKPLVFSPFPWEGGWGDGRNPATTVYCVTTMKADDFYKKLIKKLQMKCYNYIG